MEPNSALVRFFPAKFQPAEVVAAEVDPGQIASLVAGGGVELGGSEAVVGRVV